jgi:DNA polymerase I-like protein with 3'-5' exonuclease and polymerase domains
MQLKKEFVIAVVLGALMGGLYSARLSTPLNYLLQSAGAILSKRWVVVGQELLDEAGLTYERDYTRCAYMHDEVQLSVVPAEADRVAQLLEAAAPKAGQHYRFRVPIAASAGQGDSWAATERKERKIHFLEKTND